MRLIYSRNGVLERTFAAPGTWWVRKFGLEPDWAILWQAVCDRYADRIAYHQLDQPITYEELDAAARKYQKKLPGHVVKIDGTQSDWLIQAIAAWLAGSAVANFDSAWQVSDPERTALLNHISTLATDTKNSPHLVILTSGSTGKPKVVVRHTHFALFEAASYAEDLQLSSHDVAVSLVRPWFGAMTKHTLGMLLAGVTQYFAIPDNLNSNKRRILYGTPSQIATHTQSAIKWDIISLTGEPVNASHVHALRQRLSPQGVVMDAYGSTECGVIARRKVNLASLDTLYQGFTGTVLPGKDVAIHEHGALSVRVFGGSYVATGDLATLNGDTLHLLGRNSTKRKVRGDWLDTEPLLRLLRSRKDISHVVLAAEQTNTGQLIVFVSASTAIKVPMLQQWLLTNLTNLKLIPHIQMDHQRPVLGPTGKRKIAQKIVTHTIDSKYFIKIVADSILQVGDKLPLRCKFEDTPLHYQGLDSMDIAALSLELEKRVEKPLPIGTLLKTDTPKQITALLNKPEYYSRMREIGTANTSMQILCLGSGITIIRESFKTKASLLYTDLIDTQKSSFTFKQLAEKILLQEQKILMNTQSIWIAGYSINSLLAIELAYLLEKNNIIVQGLFLLDPPTLKRARYLKRKRLFLQARQWLLKKMLQIAIYKNSNRYYYELRKLAIANQPPRQIKAKTMMISCTDRTDSEVSPWLVKMPQRHIKVSCNNHFDLVATQSGISSWLPIAEEFFNHNYSKPILS